jgi:hypothetical protein
MAPRVVQPTHSTGAHGRYTDLVSAAETVLKLNRTQGVTDEAYDAAIEALDAALTALFVLDVPTHAGRWYWREWDTDVTVYKKRGGKHLYVTPPGGVEVRITHKIAGGWIAIPETGQDSGVPDPERRTAR